MSEEKPPTAHVDDFEKLLKKALTIIESALPKVRNSLKIKKKKGASD